MKSFAISQCPLLDNIFVVAPNLSAVYLPDVDSRDNVLKVSNISSPPFIF